MSLAAAAAVALAAAGDALVGEPPERLHPVAWFGRAVAPLDREWPAPHLLGFAGAVALPVLAAGVVAGAVLAVDDALAAVAGGVAGHVAAVLVAGGALFATTSRAMLLREATAVVAAAGADTAAARERAPALVGRDPADLSPAQLRSAAVESAAENLADGLVAPLAGFAVGALAAPAGVGLAVGAAGAAWVKAVNTMDSMLGYRAKPVGWAPARLDDLVMWLPARISAVLLALAAVDPGALRRGAAMADRPTSPNAGWPMATLAAALPTRLEKPGGYDLPAAPELPDREAASRGVAIVGRAGWLAVGLAAGVVAWA